MTLTGSSVSVISALLAATLGTVSRDDANSPGCGAAMHRVTGEGNMATADIDGTRIAYEVIGEGTPWAITPGGRFSKDTPGVRELAEALAGHGQQVLIWDRPNTGASDVCFEGASESAMQADRLAGLLEHLGMAPAVIVGGSGGARVSLLTAARHPGGRREAGHVVDLGRDVRTDDPRDGLLRRVDPGGLGGGDGGGGRASRVGGGARAQSRQPRANARPRSSRLHRGARGDG